MVQKGHFMNVVRNGTEEGLVSTEYHHKTYIGCQETCDDESLWNGTRTRNLVWSHYLDFCKEKTSKTLKIES